MAPAATFGDTVRASSAAFSVRVLRGPGRTLNVVKDGQAFRAVPVAGDDFAYAFTATEPGRYRLQVTRGQTIETVSSPIYLEPGRGTVRSRDCTPLGVRGKASRRMRPRRKRYLTRCTARGGDVKECVVKATIASGRGARRRTLAAGRVKMAAGSRRVRLRLNRSGRRVLRRHARRGRRVRLTFTVSDGDGATATARRRARLLRAR